RLGEASLFAFGIGRSVNRHLIEGMARSGQGEPFVVLDQAQAPAMAERFRQYVRSPVLTGIRLTFDGFEAEEVEPPAVPDLFAQRPIVVMGKYKGPARGRITVSGRTASGTFEKTMALADGLLSPDNQVLRLLWARHRIMRLSDMNSLAGDDHRIEEVTELGLKYGLMTQYTSFVAVDKVRRADGELVTVRQPLPLPSGVSDLAVGDRIKRSAAVGMMKHQAAFSEQSAENPRPAILAPGNGSKDGSGSARDEEKTAGRDSGPTLTVDEVRGRLERSAVEKRLRDEIKAMAACLAGATAAPGQAVYRFVIDESGRVAEIRVVSTSMTDPALADCIRKVIESIRFDRPDAGRATVTVRISSN
ncbi:MAG: AgmX/PglI C-terminal domain-containing protein, partial [Proteobacteria bacterium]|nr:AgmX/PglI C-terminal domain-containing protein [Pseudomonadota bacterium]